MTSRGIDGNQPDMTRRFQKFLQTIDKYGKVVDVCVQHSPEVTSLVWGSMRLMIDVGLNYLDTQEALCNSVELILTKTAMCEYYATIFLGLSLHQQSPPHAEIVKRLDVALPTFYERVLIFTVKAYGHFISRKARAWNTLIPYTQTFQPLLDAINEQEKARPTYANMSALDMIKSTWEKVQIIETAIDELKAMCSNTTKIFAEVKKTGQEVDRLLDENAKEKLMKCREWLNFVNPESEYKRHQNAKMEGTCGWIFENIKFKDWVGAAKGRNHLWIKGKPGAGKSVISAAILERYALTQPANRVFLYFFFRNGDSRTEGVAAMLASLIEQLFRTDMHHRELFKVIEKPYELYGSSPCDSADRLWEILGKMLSGFPVEVSILLDALDECNDRESIFDHVDSNAIKARFLFTSRPEPDICTAIEKSSNFHVVEMDAGEDIERFVTSKVKTGSPLAPFKDLIMNKLMETSDGMFRYAMLMIEQLDNPSDSTIPEILDSLPKDLNEMYKLALQRLPEKLRELRRTTLTYISCAHRPVTVDEVIYAHAAKPGEQDFDPEQKRLATKNDILRSCGSLIEVFTYSFDDYGYWERKEHGLCETEALRFSHLTVKDFLVEDPSVILAMNASNNTKYNPKTALEVSMARITTTQISIKAFNFVRDRKPSPLFYATTYALEHAAPFTRQDLHHEDVVSDFRRILFTTPGLFELWKANIVKSRLKCKEFSQLHIIAAYGLQLLIDEGVSHEPNANIFDSSDRTPLWYAAYYDHEAVVRLLVKLGADANAQGGYYGNALQAAAYNGKETMVRLLVESGVDVNAQGGHFGNALQAAAYHGNEAVVRLLVKTGAEVNAQGGRYGNALYAAVCHGNEAVARLLVKLSAKANAQGGN